MTFVVCVKVNDGVVMAGDSATTMSNQSYFNIYDNANKVYNLLRYEAKTMPVGAVTYGLGNIGTASIAAIAKDFRKCAANTSNVYYIDPENYTVGDVAEKFRQFVFDDRYEPFFAEMASDQRPDIGFYLAGYSSGESESQIYSMSMVGGNFYGINDVSVNSTVWGGQPEAVHRLVNGFSMHFSDILMEKLQQLGFTLSIQQMMELNQHLLANLGLVMANPAMPIQDAIDLANFLVETTIQWVRFAPGVQTVGGPVEIAVITKHEGFKWVKRKHYYPAALNP